MHLMRFVWRAKYELPTARVNWLHSLGQQKEQEEEHCVYA